MKQKSVSIDNKVADKYYSQQRQTQLSGETALKLRARRLVCAELATKYALPIKIDEVENADVIVLFDTNDGDGGYSQC
jgi:hypothetical protein